MKTIVASLRRRVPATAFMAVILALPSSVFAASYTWNGSTAAGWANTANWDGGPPVFDTTADLQFTTSAVTFPSTAIGAVRIVRSLNFGASVASAMGISLNASGATSFNLTLQADAGSASINVAAGSTGDITIGNGGLGSAFGNVVLGSNLNVVHDGSGLLLINRPINETGGARSITKTGTGTMQVNNNNTFTGAVNINGGKLIANAQSTTGGDLNGASAINLGGGELVARANFANKAYDNVAVNVNSASTLSWENVNNFTYTLSFGGSAAFALNANLTAQNISTDTTFANSFNISRSITGSGNLTVKTYNNIVSSANNYSLGRILLSGDNSAWIGNLEVARGTASLSGNAVNSAGTGNIIIGTTADAFGAGLTFFPTSANGTTATFNNNITVRSGGFRSIKGSGTDHNVVLGGNVALEGTLNVDHNFSTSGRFINLAGNISGSGGLDITRSGGNANSFARLTGTNTYNGATTIDSGATLQVGGGGTTGSIANTSGLTNNGTVAYNRSDALSVGYVISGSGAVNKLAGGTTTLTANNSYSGATNVNVGTLLVNGTQTGTGLTTVASGATLGGSGTLGGALSVSGTVAPGTSPGLLTVASSVSILDGGAMAFELNGLTVGSQYDRLTMLAGTFSLTDTNDLQLSLGFTPALNNIFYIVDNQGVSAVAGIFEKLNGVTTDLSQGATFSLGGSIFKISYEAITGSAFTGGNDIALQVVPEPGTFAMILGGFGMLFAFQRSRRRRA